jgi:hypothetical protein
MENSISVSQIRQVQNCKAMQKLKFEPVNGYGVLVENKLIVDGEKYTDSINKAIHNWDMGTGIHKEKSAWCDVIIFAEKELGLEGVPIFEWREFEVWQKSKEVKHWGQFASTAFVKGYKSNPAKYTESDLRSAIKMAVKGMLDSGIKGWTTITENEIIQSLQKYPKWVVMESYCTYGDNCPSEGAYDKQHLCNVEYKLFTNSEGKQQGTVKEIIWT